MKQLTSNRFGWVLEGKKKGPQTCDVEVTGDSELAIVPTLGSILPGWLLAIPRKPVLSLRELNPAERCHLFQYSAATATRLVSFAPNVFFFEHGASNENSLLGCGVDQAHLHLVPTRWDLIQHVLRDNSVDWSMVDNLDPWASVPRGAEYYIISDLNRAYVGLPRSSQSQFFRKKIAELNGASNEWDYRKWPHHESIRRTIDHFRVEPIGEAA